MKLADGIRKHGFRKWYERELLQSHAHLLLTFLSALGLFMAFEAMARFRTLGDQLLDLGSIAVCGAVGLWSLRRYLYLLLHAESTAHQAECGQCRAYARFDVVDEGPQRLRVRCRRCENHWHIES